MCWFVSNIGEHTRLSKCAIPSNCPFWSCLKGRQTQWKQPVLRDHTAQRKPRQGPGTQLCPETQRLSPAELANRTVDVAICQPNVCQAVGYGIGHWGHGSAALQRLVAKIEFVNRKRPRFAENLEGCWPNYANSRNSHRTLYPTLGPANE